MAGPSEMNSTQPPAYVSGESYDWRLTRQPERPWRHAYHQMLVDKTWIGTKANPQTGEAARLDHNAEQVLERIRWVAQVTRGLPRITYLIGWQHDGHDSKYPDWSVVNPRLKRPQDATARESLIWLMREARKYNTTVSLHVNMTDAYENSPLWDEYVAKGVIVRDKGTGQLYRSPGAVWGGEQAYWIDHEREWATGLAQRRIDGLLDLLPIAEAGTIHIDAFYITDHTKIEAQKAAIRKEFRYWRDRGVDVTSEAVFHQRQGEAFIGLQPMSYVVNMKAWGYSTEKPELTDEQRMEIPAWLYCHAHDDVAQEAGQLFGTSMVDETLATPADFVRPFCLQVLPWYFLNRHNRLRLRNEPDGARTLELSDGVVSRVSGDGHRTIQHQGRLLVDGTDVCVPALWRPHRELIAFSKTGYAQRSWTLPFDWHDVQKVEVFEVGPAGQIPLKTLSLSGGQVSLALRAGQMVCIVPAGTSAEAVRQEDQEKTDYRSNRQEGVE